jgi:hypothetical protein
MEQERIPIAELYKRVDEKVNMRTLLKQLM